MITKDLDIQLDYLEREYKEKHSDNDTWKLVTLLIGFNDVNHKPCDELILSPESYKEKVESAVERLKDIFGDKVIIVVMGLLDLGEYKKWKSGFCSDDELVCSSRVLSSRVKQYNEKLAEMGNHEESQKVVYWDGLSRLDFKDLSQDFVSEYDCFHPSEKGQEKIAGSLWNFLFNDKKELIFDPICPK